MSGVKPLVLLCLAAVPAAIQAEIIPLDEATLGDVTAQGGLSIELAAALDVAQIAYRDEGFLVVSNLSLAGSDLGQNPDSRLDNVLLTIDVAGADDAAALQSKWGWGFTGGFLQDSRARRPVIQDGDLVIKFNANDFDLNDFNQLFTSVDYGLSIGSVGLAKSTGGDVGTILASDIFLTGFLGPIDIVIQEEITTNTQVMNINGYFTTDGTITADFIGTTFDLHINNFRGANRFPYAHFQLDIGTRRNAAGEADGLVIIVEDFSGDMDLGNITVGGDAGRAALGDVYLTDFAIQAELVVYGH